MSSEPSDNIDFKPFFDLVVGVLFILLILISAQLFFSRWDQLAQQPARPTEQFTWDEEARRFLDDMRDRLAAAGFNTGVDVARRSVAFQLADILEPEGGLKPAPMATLARAVGQTALCLQPSAPAPCPGYRELQRGRLMTSLWLEGGSLPGLPPEESARLLSLQILNGLMAATPGLIALRGSDGAPYLHITPDARLRPTAQAEGMPRGIVELRFEFAGKRPL
jgi:hypothetical protein